jgi:O-antigen/teichoic acid export membrane protein
VPAVSNIALNLLLIPLMGLMGAAVASCLSFGLGLAGSWLLGLKTLALPVPVLDLSKTLLSVVLMMAAVALVPALDMPLLDLIAKGIMGVIIYAILAYAFDLNDIREPAGRIFNRIRAKVFA